MLADLGYFIAGLVVGGYLVDRLQRDLLADYERKIENLIEKLEVLDEKSSADDI